MKVNQKTDEQQLKSEIRWMKEALAISEFERENPYDAIVEARKECFPIHFRRYCDKDPSELRKAISRRRSDLKSLMKGGWE